MLPLILGNAFSLLATLCDALSASRKTHRSILMVQNLSQFFYGLAGFLLKGYSATVQNAISILRNFVATGKVQSKWIEWSFIALGVVLGVVFNNLGLLGLLPVIANLVYSLAVFRFKEDEVKLKAAFLFSVLLFTIFNACIWNIVGAVSNGVLFCVTAAFLIKSVKKA